MKTTFLDADFVLKTTAVKDDKKISVFDKVMELDHDFFICQKVLYEIKSQSSEAFDVVTSYVTQDKISVVDYISCLKLLSAAFKNLAISIFLGDFKDIIESFDGSSDLYDKYFSSLEIYAQIKNIASFAGDFENALRQVPAGSSMGELLTILMLKIYHRCGVQELYGFMSDDGDARAAATNVLEDLQTYNCSSVFILLKAFGLSYEEAEKFAINWDLKQGIRKVIFFEQDRRFTHNNQYDFIVDLYQNGNYKIRRIGYPERVS